MLTIAQDTGAIIDRKPPMSLIKAIAANPTILVRVNVAQRVISTTLDLREMSPDMLRVLITKAAAELNRRK
jgi:hypothetical protein